MTVAELKVIRTVEDKLERLLDAGMIVQSITLGREDESQVCTIDRFGKVKWED